MNKFEMQLYNCNSEEELFDYIIDLKKTECDNLVEELLEKLRPRQKKDFIHYLNDIYFEAPDEITWISYKLTELL